MEVSMDVVERNDVDISKLFKWGRVYEVVGVLDDAVEALIYMKLLGDADLNRARVYALRESGALRKKLRDETSDEYLAYLSPMEDLTRVDMENMITVLSMREVSNRVRRSVSIKEPVPPRSDAPLEEMESYQKEVDEYEAKRREEIAKAVDRELTVLREGMKNKTDDEIRTLYKKLLINEACEEAAIQAFQEMQVYLGCFKDSDYNERFFSSLEEFKNLPPAVKKDIMDAYFSMDIDPTELKKLRRAMR